MTDTSAALVLDLPLSADTRLVVDAGGSTLRLVECDLDGRELTSERIRNPGDQLGDMLEGIASFVIHLGHRPAIAVVGAAGPIEQARRVKLTNVPTWPVFDADAAEASTGIRFFLFNDLVVAAAAVPALGNEHLQLVRPGKGESDGPKVVATLSTGVNDALVLSQATFGPLRYVAGETGHAPFAPRDDTEIELLRFAWTRQGPFVSYEDVLSAGRGFRMVYDFVTTVEGVGPTDGVVQSLVDGRPCGPVMSEGMKSDDPACARVLTILGGIYGTYLGSRAIAACANGGVFLVGSVPKDSIAMTHFIERSPFIDRFGTAGRQTALVENVPIVSVTHPDPGLLGAAEIARHLR